ncbi:MAG: helix-turn-helix domain-containing protein [Pseudomonadota bacterium]
MAAPTTRGRSYGQYCPLALAAELLCRRWTLLIISRLLDGCRSFNEIHQGVPQISPSLLTARLNELIDAGLVERQPTDRARRYRYEPTAATLDLAPLVDGLAVWGQHWARDMEREDLDPAFLAWSMSMRMNTQAMPPGRTVIRFEFAGTPAGLKRFWLVCEAQAVDMCVKDPGHEASLIVEAPLRTFVEAWRGIRDLPAELRRGTIRLVGPRALVRAFPNWLLLSALAPHPRKAAGREQTLARAPARAQEASVSARKPISRRK